MKIFGDPLPVWGNPNLIINQRSWCISSWVDANYEHSVSTSKIRICCFRIGKQDNSEYKLRNYQITDKETDGSRDVFIIRNIISGLWAVEWAGLCKKIWEVFYTVGKPGF